MTGTQLAKSNANLIVLAHFKDGIVQEDQTLLLQTALFIVEMDLLLSLLKNAMMKI